MSIVYNGTEIENITYNGTTLDNVKYNNTEVFSGVKYNLSVTKGSYISSIIINSTTYSSNTTVSIKPGTSVTLNCNVYSTSISNGLSTTYSFSNWTGYTTNTNQSFTFIMPTSNITYTANGKIESQTFGWPSSGNISESRFLNGINNSSYDTSLVGRTVTLTESSSTHNWIIVRVNTNSYDLWYKGSIGTASWAGTSNSRIGWMNSDSTNTNTVRGLCTSYKSKLSSSIQAKLKPYLNRNCGDDLIVILSVIQLGSNGVGVTNDSNSKIPYFNSKDRRNTGGTYWTTSNSSANVGSLFTVTTGGDTSSVYYRFTSDVNPAIRVG